MRNGFLYRLSITALATGTLLTASGRTASATPLKLLYRVTHSTYGTIGTYTNIVDTIGNATTVTTEGRIRVGLLGVKIGRAHV